MSKKTNMWADFKKKEFLKCWKRETVQEIHQYKDIANAEGDLLYSSYLKLVI
jgi:hypothetical protein